jgi:hypothetical protein
LHYPESSTSRRARGLARSGTAIALARRP